MAYLKHEEVTVTKLVCSHPKVKRIWEWGGASVMATDGNIYHSVSLILDNDGNEERKDFRLKEYGDYSEIEKYLEGLK